MSVEVSGLPKVSFDRESVRVFVPQRGWVVYHILGPGGELLYTGATGRPRGRFLEHVRDGMFPTAELVAVERFGSSTAMARREREVTDLTGPESFGRRHASWRARPARQLEVAA